MGQLDCNFVSEREVEGTRFDMGQGVRQGAAGLDGVEAGVSALNDQWEDIYDAVVGVGRYNYCGARVPVPSGLCVDAWRRYLQSYPDVGMVDFLEFGWPVNFDRSSPLRSTMVNHTSALQYPADLDFYISTELGHGALLGPFDGPPFLPTHVSPLMTRPKKGSEHRRIIMDLSWPHGESVNDGVSTNLYVDGPARIYLPTVDYMEARLLEMGKGAYMYKTDLSRGYRQLRVDPTDWPLLSFTHRGGLFVDICPPFGLRSAAHCMQRTSEAVSFIHGQKGYISRPYLDDFGGAEATEGEANDALDTLQEVMAELGVQEARHKVCRPARQMVWLGILFDAVEMTMEIPQQKMGEVAEQVEEWMGKKQATQREMQSLLGLLQFVASVSPPARIFTNRMLENLREAPRRGSETLSLGFKRDLRFFQRMLPEFNGVKIIVKQDVECQEALELDACLTGCGAFEGRQYYSVPFPDEVKGAGHTIAHLETLNIVVAVKCWAARWAGKRVGIKCDNMNACLAIRSGRSRDQYLQSCVRELFVYTAAHDIELRVEHCPGVRMIRADALSRAPTDATFRERVERDRVLQRAQRIAVPDRFFRIDNDL